jgi:iron complex outermembrane recepter protein
VQRQNNTSAWGEHSGAVGLQLGLQNVSTGAHAEELLAPAESRRIAGYIFEELKMAGGRKVQVAGRVEHVKIDGTGALFPGDPASGFLPPPDEPDEFASKPGFTPISGSIGFLQDLPNGMVASLTLQHVERAPEITELFSKGAHHASHSFEIGNPDLKIEKAQSIEIGLKKAGGPFRFDGSAYYTRYRNFIYRHETGVECGEDFDTCGIEDEFHQIYYNQRAATFYGAEVAVQLDVAPIAGGMWGVDGQYDFVHAKFNDGSYLPRIPPRRLGGGLFWRNENWLARVSLLHAFAQNRLAEDETSTSSYNLMRAELSYRQKLPDGRSVSFGVTGDNLLNERIRNHSAFNKDDVLQPGRNIRGFAKVTF